MISLPPPGDPGVNGGTRVEQGHEESDVWRALAAEIIQQRSTQHLKDLSFSRARTRREMQPE